MKINEEAKKQVIDGERACTPPDCPLSFTEVLSAKFTNTKKNVAVAEVRMFDGLLGTVEVSQVPFGLASRGWCIQWLDLPGGAVECVGNTWRRVDKSVVPVQVERIEQGVLF